MKFFNPPKPLHLGHDEPQNPWIQAVSRRNGHRSRRRPAVQRRHGRVNFDTSERDLPGSDPDRSERDMSNLGGGWRVAPADAGQRPSSARGVAPKAVTPRAER